MSYELNIRCKNCTRYIPVKAVKTSEIEVRCSDRKCKQWQTVKIVMLSDMYGGQKHSHDETQPNASLILDMKKQALKLDGRTKEAKKLQSTIADMEKYIASLEGIIDGQG